MKKAGKSLLLLLTICLTACQSAKSVYEKGDASLVVLIIDENNQAVEDYAVVLEGSKRTGSLMTNSQGMCSFTRIEKTAYFLDGQKNGYTSLEHIPVELEKNGNVLCFSVASQKSVFKKALELYEQKLFVDGLSVLNALCVNPASWSCTALGLYKTVGLLKTNQKMEAQNQINKTRKLLYEVEGNIFHQDNQFFLEGDFFNHTELQVKAFTVVFNVCDADGETVAVKKNNVVHKIEKNVFPYSHYKFSVSLNDYFTEEQLTQILERENKTMSAEYLYVSQIEYADDFMWMDPFGFEVFGADQEEVR